MATAIHRASISTSSHTYSARNSREHLIPKSSRPRSVRATHVRSARALQLALASKGGGVALEQKRSHGIGGAGNIRRPSEVVYPLKLNADGTRKRGTVWSGMSIVARSSPSGKRSGFSGLFVRRGGLAGSPFVGDPEQRGVAPKERDSGGNES